MVLLQQPGGRVTTCQRESLQIFLDNGPVAGNPTEKIFHYFAIKALCYNVSI